MRTLTCVFALAAVAAFDPAPCHAQSPGAGPEHWADAPVAPFNGYFPATSMGDLDADGDPDAFGWTWISAGRYDQLSVIVQRNDGQGGFRQAWSSYITVNATAQMTWDTALGDLDTEAGKDVVAAFGRSVRAWKSLNVWIGVYGLQGYGVMTMPFDVHAVKLLDLDGDGLDDLVLIGAEIRVYQNTGRGLQLIDQYPLSGTELHVAELDGQPGDDLLVPQNGRAEILRWTGSRLERAATVTHGVAAAASPMHVVGDIDGDSDADLVLFEANGQYTVVRRTGATSWQVEPVALGGPATGLADIDGDGDLDGVCCGGGGPPPVTNTQPSTFHVSRNRGDGTFDRAFTMKGLGAKRLAGAVDVDGDGDLDLVGGRAVWFNLGAMLEVDPQPNLPVPVKAPVHTCDWDGDGDPDIFVGTRRVLINDGSGSFADVRPQLPPPSPGTEYATKAYRGDFDGDGDEDLIVGEYDAQGLAGMRLFRNAGGGACADGGPAAAPGAGFPAQSKPFGESYLATDVDGNGTLDVVQGAVGAGVPTTVWLNDGGGYFTRGPSFSSGVPMLAVDADNNGDIDLLTHTRLMMGDGTGNFTPGNLVPTLVVPNQDTMAAGDLDGNGFVDFGWLTNEPSGKVRLAFNQGGGVFTMNQIATVPMPRLDPAGVQFVDLDRDGNKDVAVWPGTWWKGRGVEVYFGDGQGRFSRNTRHLADARGPFVDVDGDGDLDAIGDTSVTRGAPAVLPRDGYRLQYGNRTASAGMEATLGAVGPFRVGTRTELLVSGAPGSAVVVLGIGVGNGPLSNWPFPGFTGHVSQIYAWGLGLATGNIGEGGTGAWRLAFVPPLAVSGGTTTYQAWTWDPASTTIAHTNGLELRWK